jgi:hypothetical protein
MVSFFQGLGLAAGSFSDVIEEKQKQRDLAAREERIAKRDRAWQVEDFEKKAELVRKKEESERLRKEEEAERASLAFARVNGINSQAWNTLTREQREVFIDSVDMYDMSGSQVWDLSYNQNTGTVALPPIPKKPEARYTVSSLQAESLIKLQDPNVSEEERKRAQETLDRIKGLNESTDKTKESVSYGLAVYSKMFDQVNPNKKFDKAANAIIYDADARSVLDGDNFEKLLSRGTPLNTDTYKTMAKVFPVFRNEAAAHSQMIWLSNSMANNYAEDADNNYYFKRRVIENELATREAVSNLVNSVTLTTDFIAKKLEGVSDGNKSYLEEQFNALAISTSNSLKNYLPRVYLNGISTIDNIDMYLDEQKTYKTFFGGKEVKFKVKKVQEGEDLFPSYTDIQGNPIDPSSPLAKYISEGPTS